MSSASASASPILSRVRSGLAQRRQQLTAVASLVHVPAFIILFLIFLYRSPVSRRYLGIRVGRWIFGLYLCWMIGWDYWTPRRGGRPSPALRRAHMWQVFRQYFPATIIKKCNIDPSRKYVLGVHPHGIMGVAAWANIISDAGVFPGLDYRVVTVSSNFNIPVWRDAIMAMGLTDCSRDSIQYMLKHNISVGVVVGGAAEALDARPGTNDLTLTRRLGFVRLAIENGADLIPIFSFGENDLYHQVIPNPPDSVTRRIQERMMSMFGYSLPLVTGRFGIVPHRRPITTIVGEPLHVPHIPKPTLPQILEVHGRYVRALQSLYDEFRPIVYHLHPDHPLSAAPDLRLVDKLRSRDIHKLAKREMHAQNSTTGTTTLNDTAAATATSTSTSTSTAVASESGIPSSLQPTLNRAIDDTDASAVNPLAARVAQSAAQLQTRRARL